MHTVTCDMYNKTVYWYLHCILAVEVRSAGKTILNNGMTIYTVAIHVRFEVRHGNTRSKANYDIGVGYS